MKNPAIIAGLSLSLLCLNFKDMTKVCLICETEFTPSKRTESYAVCCSGKCNLKKWRKENPAHNRRLKVERNRRIGVVEFGSTEHRSLMAAKSLGNKNRFKGGYENHLMHNRKRRIIKMSATGSHSLNDWLKLKAKHNNSCLCCNRAEPEIVLTEDHIIPLSKGGSDFIENIQPLCKSCNSKKHNKTINFICQ